MAKTNKQSDCLCRYDSGERYEQFCSEVAWYKHHGHLTHTQPNKHVLVEGIVLVCVWQESTVVLSLQATKELHVSF